MEYTSCYYEYNKENIIGIMSKFCLGNLNIYRFFPYHDKEQKLEAISCANELLLELNKEFVDNTEDSIDLTIPEAIYRSTKVPSVRSVYPNGFLVGFKSMVPLNVKYTKNTHFLIKDFPSLKDAWGSAVRLSFNLRGFTDKDIPSISVKYYTEIEIFNQ